MRGRKKEKVKKEFELEKENKKNSSQASLETIWYTVILNNLMYEETKFILVWW